MRWSRDGVMEATSLLEAATFHRSIKPVCSCGHSARFEGCGLWWHFHRRGWDDRLSDARARFWCRLCQSRKRKKVRAALIEVVFWEEGDLALPLPDERTWKQVKSRLR